MLSRLSSLFASLLIASAPGGRNVYVRKWSIPHSQLAHSRMAFQDILSYYLTCCPGSIPVVRPIAIVCPIIVGIMVDARDQALNLRLWKTSILIVNLNYQLYQVEEQFHRNHRHNSFLHGKQVSFIYLCLKRSRAAQEHLGRSTDMEQLQPVQTILTAAMLRQYSQATNR